MPDPRDTSGGQFPSVEVGGRLMYEDYHGGLHSTQREAIEANAWINEGRGDNPCQRGLDIPDFIPGSDPRRR